MLRFPVFSRIVETEGEGFATFQRMRHGILILVCGLLVGCGKGFPTSSQGRLDQAVKKLATASQEVERFYALNDAAKQSFEVGRVEDARKYAKDLLTLAENYQRDWNYGNAIQDGNLVLGRIALKEGRMEEAKQHLLAAGKSPGSPQMDSFGPNMSLAKDLLEKGERDTVLQYFELCRNFWQMGQSELDQWTKDVKASRIPAFGANLVY
jgi:tetratricopeptide (TPR) repeat protein